VRARSGLREEELGGRPEPAELLLVVGGLLPEGLVDDEALVGQPYPAHQCFRQRQGAELLECPGPGEWRAGRSHGQATLDGLVEGQRIAGVVEECVGAHREGRGFPAVDRGDLLGLGVVVDEEAAATDARGIGLRHAQGCRRGDCGVGGVAARGQDVQADLRRIGIDRGNRAAGPDGERLLLHRVARGGAGRQGGRKEDAGGQSRKSQQGGASTRHENSLGAIDALAPMGHLGGT
jgi:hypothetical protein